MCSAAISTRQAWPATAWKTIDDQSCRQPACPVRQVGFDLSLGFCVPVYVRLAVVANDPAFSLERLDLRRADAGGYVVAVDIASADSMPPIENRQPVGVDAGIHVVPGSDQRRVRIHPHAEGVDIHHRVAPAAVVHVHSNQDNIVVPGHPSCPLRLGLGLADAVPAVWKVPGQAVLIVFRQPGVGGPGWV